MNATDPATRGLGAPRPLSPRSLWWVALIVGVTSLAAGIITLAWPDISLVALATVTGIYFLSMGISDCVEAILRSDEPGNERVLAAILGLLGVIAGVICIRHPGASLVAIVLVIGAYLVAAGVMRFVRAWALAEGRVAQIALGVLDVIGGIIIVSIPEIGLATLAAIAGIVFIVRGCLALAAAFGLRKLPA